MLDSFSFVNLFQYVMVGKYYKNKYFLILVFGIFWEIFEYLLASTEKTREFLKKYWFVPKKFWDEKIENKCTDLVFRMVGYHIGNVYL